MDKKTKVENKTRYVLCEMNVISSGQCPAASLW